MFCLSINKIDNDIIVGYLRNRTQYYIESPILPKLTAFLKEKNRKQWGMGNPHLKGLQILNIFQQDTRLTQENQ